MPSNIAVIWKAVGQTPLQALEAFRSREGIPREVPLTYAGRLDPMAEGILLILIGEECKKKDQYTALPKEYEFEILFGVSSDTGDILGLSSLGEVLEVSQDKIAQVASSFVGKHTFSYPVFSSRTVQGKPLHAWALEGRLSEIEIPKHEAEIFDIDLRGMKYISSVELLREINHKISLFVPDELSHSGPGGDFRKVEILSRWKEVLSGANTHFPVVAFRAKVSSGTYIRALAEKIAEKCGTVGLAYSIRRTRVGDLTLLS